MLRSDHETCWPAELLTAGLVGQLDECRLLAVPWEWGGGRGHGLVRELVASRRGSDAGSLWRDQLALSPTADTPPLVLGASTAHHPLTLGWHIVKQCVAHLVATTCHAMCRLATNWLARRKRPSCSLGLSTHRTVATSHYWPTLPTLISGVCPVGCRRLPTSCRTD